MKSFRDMNPFLIGLVSVTVIAVATAAAFLVGIDHILERAYPVRAVFSDAAGIRVGDDVRVAGVKSGRVTKVVADRRAGNVVVDMVVNDGVQLGPDTHAEIALQTLLGTKFVRLSGTVVQPYLRSGAVIPRERTKTPFDVFELTKIGTRTVEETDTAKLNQFIKQLADITEGKQQSIGQLLDGITQVSQALHERDQQLRDLFDKTDQLSGVLASKDQTLVSLIDQSQGILQFLQTRRAQISDSLGKGAAAVDELSRLIDTNKANIDAILADLHPTLDVVARHQTDINNALAFLGPGTLGLAKATSHGPWQDIYVRDLGPSLVCLISNNNPLPHTPVPGC
ncbi:MAG TPA: MlaD family protein [Acidimicrobiales bacterium]|nr:MlaD family protein [Acidimicrobiales bacterium]